MLSLTSDPFLYVETEHFNTDYLAVFIFWTVKLHFFWGLCKVWMQTADTNGRRRTIILYSAPLIYVLLRATYIHAGLF